MALFMTVSVISFILTNRFSISINPVATNYNYRKLKSELHPIKRALREDELMIKYVEK